MNYGENMKQKVVFQKIFRFLTKKFSMVVIVVEEAKYLSNFTLEELTRSLLSHEARLNQEEESLTNAFNT